MDIKELKKLINEEVSRRRIIKEQDQTDEPSTGAGRPSAIARQRQGRPTKGQETQNQLLLQKFKTELVPKAQQLLNNQNISTEMKSLISKILELTNEEDIQKIINSLSEFKRMNWFAPKEGAQTVIDFMSTFTKLVGESKPTEDWLGQFRVAGLQGQNPVSPTAKTVAKVSPTAPTVIKKSPTKQSFGSKLRSLLPKKP